MTSPKTPTPTTDSPMVAAIAVIKLSAPLKPEEVEMRQDGRAVERRGKYYARFVPYTTAQAIRRRLDDNFPGQWSFDVLPLPELGDDDGRPLHAVKGVLRIEADQFQVSRADVGQGADWKVAATDAFKRAAQRLGIGNELYEMEQVWVEVDSNGKYPKPVEDPVDKLFRMLKGEKPEVIVADTPAPPSSQAAAPNDAKADAKTDVPPCPDCGGRMWDNRKDKRNPRAPDFKCRDTSCKGVIWPSKQKSGNTAAVNAAAADTADGDRADVRPFQDIVNEETEYSDGLPF